jgi:hypothetical protein
MQRTQPLIYRDRLRTVRSTVQCSDGAIFTVCVVDMTRDGGVLGRGNRCVFTRVYRFTFLL